jgi:hypothetical protein
MPFKLRVVGLYKILIITNNSIADISFSLLPQIDQPGVCNYKQHLKTCVHSIQSDIDPLIVSQIAMSQSFVR